MSAAERFDAIYRSRLRAGRTDWHDDQETIREVLSYLDELLAVAHASCPQEKGCKVLELGCGSGTLTFPLAKRGYDVLGVDISPVAITRAEARAVLSGPEGQPGNAGRTQFLVHDVTSPLAGFDGCFPLVVDGLVLHYLTRPADRMGMLRLAARALRPAGTLLIMTMCQDPRRIPAGTRFDIVNRCLISKSQAECRYASIQDLAAEFCAAGLVTAYQRIVEGDTATGQQDMFLAVLKKDPAGHEADGNRGT